MALRPASDTEAIMSLYTTKSYLFGQMGQLRLCPLHTTSWPQSSSPSVQADACRYWSAIQHQTGNNREAYELLSRFVTLADTIREQRHTEESIALQELYRHEQLSVENLHWRTQAARSAGRLSAAGPGFPAADMLVTIVGLLYRRSRQRVNASAAASAYPGRGTGAGT